MLADRQTDRQTDTQMYSSQYFATAPTGGVIIYSNHHCALIDISKRYNAVILASRTGSEYVTLLPMCTNKCCPLYYNKQ